MIDRLLSLFVAVSLALLVWLYARSRDQEVLDHVPIPVEVTLAPGQRHLPVRFDSSLEPASGPFSIDPASVLVQGPLEILERTSAIPTQPWILRGQGRDLVPLLRELENQPIRCEPATVHVKRLTP